MLKVSEKKLGISYELIADLIKKDNALSDGLSRVKQLFADITEEKIKKTGKEILNNNLVTEFKDFLIQDKESILNYYIRKFGDEEETDIYVSNYLKTTVAELKQSYEKAEKCHFCSDLLKQKYKNWMEIQDMANQYIIFVKKSSLEAQIEVIIDHHKETSFSNFQKAFLNLEYILRNPQYDYRNFCNDVKNFYSSDRMPYSKLYISNWGIRRYWFYMRECSEYYINLAKKLYGVESKEYKEIIEKQQQFLNLYQDRWEDYIESQKIQQAGGLKGKQQLALNTLREYLQVLNNMSIDNFCRKKNISVSTFEEYLDIIERCDPEIFEQYHALLNHKQSSTYAILKSKILEIAKLLQDGVVEENNVTREFNMLDYFRITKLDYGQFIRLASSICTTDQFRSIRTFIAKNKPIPLNIKEELAAKTIVAGREVTTEEKLTILEYMKKNHLPMYIKVYNLVKKEYLDGKIVLETKENVNQKTMSYPNS
ncbi:MAG: hypothetical protein PUB18_05575 [bacterium]|nr:hypothetical protein [bacterium]